MTNYGTNCYELIMDRRNSLSKWSITGDLMIRVLLIEDNEDDALKIRKALSKSADGIFLDGFDFVMASSLRQGIKALGSENIDVVLLDLGLPDARGFEGIVRLRKAFPFIPTIILTKQHEETLIAVEAVKMGAQDYFSKSNLSDIFSLDRIIRYAIERKKLEQTIVEAKEEAERAKEQALKASKAKSEFLSSMSHDIRTPLNCIIGVADLLSRAKLSEEEVNYVQMLNKASDNLLSLINDILDLAKIESGQIKISSISFDLLKTVESVLDFTSNRAHAKGLELIFHIAPDVPRQIVGDPEHLNQILINLLGNAIKFTKSGEVVLEIKKINFTGTNFHLQFQVKDTGIGIPSDKLLVIFESFIQLDHKDALKRQGSGLGLSICKRLISMMNGKINAASELGKGSTFTVDIPFKESNEVSKIAIIPSLHLTNIDVLVTDDNLLNRTILGELLNYWKANVFLTKNMQEAEDLCSKRDKKFEIAIFDIRMPGVGAGGIELAEKLKDKINSTILMLPTNHRYGDIERLKNAGITKYFFKPAKPEQLAGLISEISNKELHPNSEIANSSMNASQKKPLRLLVADDSEENRQLIAAYCKDTCLSLTLAEDGKDAFEKFKKAKYDLVLMDLQMPQMNGYEAFHAIRDWEKNQNKTEVPVLALTAYALKEEAEKCMAAGFGAHLTKPIRKNDLLQAIKKFAS